MELLRQRSNDSLKSELAATELRVARSSESFQHLTGSEDSGGVVPLQRELDAELMRVVAGLPDTLAGLRALCALVPQVKDKFARDGGMEKLVTFVSSADMNATNQAIYTLAALIDDAPAARACIDAGLVEQLTVVLAACDEDQLRESVAMAVDRLTDTIGSNGSTEIDVSLARLIPTFVSILNQTLNQQVQYRFAAALARLLLLDQADVATSFRIDPRELLRRAVVLLGSPVKEVQTASAQLCSALLDRSTAAAPLLDDTQLALQITQQLLQTFAGEASSVTLPALTACSHCISKLVEMPRLRDEFSGGGRFASHRSECIECVARSVCTARVRDFEESCLLRVDGGDAALFATGWAARGVFSPDTAGGPRQSADFRCNPQWLLTINKSTKVNPPQRPLTIGHTAHVSNLVLYAICLREHIQACCTHTICVAICSSGHILCLD
jgi:hypothetical protein